MPCIRHESIGNRRSEIFLRSHKYLCKNCHRYFNQQFPGILKWQRATEAFRREVFEKHKLGISQVDLARSLGFSTTLCALDRHRILDIIPELMKININQAFLKTWHLLDPSAKYSRGLLSLMRKRYMATLAGLEPIYSFKQSLTQLLLVKHQSHQQTARLIPKFLKCILELKNANFEPLVSLGKTLEHWQNETYSAPCLWLSKF